VRRPGRGTGSGESAKGGATREPKKAQRPSGFPGDGSNTLDQSRETLKQLILRVVDLCRETRELAESGTTDAGGIARVHEATAAVHGAAQALRIFWQTQAFAPPLPAAPEFEAPSLLEDGTADNWLFGGQDPLESSGSWFAEEE